MQYWTSTSIPFIFYHIDLISKKQLKVLQLKIKLCFESQLYDFDLLAVFLVLQRTLVVEILVTEER